MAKRNRGRLTIRSPKTEHHEGKETRTIPIFPELRPYMEAVWDETPEGSEHVIAIPSLRRDRYANVGTMMAKIVRRSGLTPWPKLFHNMRATRETELAQHYPMHVVCEWIGNSQPVALKHYLRVTDADYTRAVSNPTSAPKAIPGAPEKSAAVNAQGALQNMVQHAAAVVSGRNAKSLGEPRLRASFSSVFYGTDKLPSTPKGSRTGLAQVAMGQVI